MAKTLKVLNGDISVSKEEFQKEMEDLLQSNQALNSVSQTVIYKIIDLYETARMAKEAIVENGGVLINQEQANGTMKLVANPAVAMQSNAISGMAKLINQLGLDKMEMGGGDIV